MSQENAEVIRRVFVEALGDGVDVAPLFRDDATWTRRRAELEAIFEPDCAVAWIAQGEPPIEATGLYLVRDGRVARVEHYANPAEALAAVGLRE